jgi:hypothetical protein
MEDIIYGALRVADGSLDSDTEERLYRAIAGAFAFGRAIRILQVAREEILGKIVDHRAKADAYAVRFQPAYEARNAESAARAIVLAHHWHTMETIQWHLFCIAVFRHSMLFRKIYELLGISLDGFQTELERKYHVARNQLEHIDEKLADAASRVPAWQTLHRIEQGSISVGFQRNSEGEVRFVEKDGVFWVPFSEAGMAGIQSHAEVRAGAIMSRCRTILEDFCSRCPHEVESLIRLIRENRLQIDALDLDSESPGLS